MPSIVILLGIVLLLNGLYRNRMSRKQAYRQGYKFQMELYSWIDQKVEDGKLTPADAAELFPDGELLQLNAQGRDGEFDELIFSISKNGRLLKFYGWIALIIGIIGAIDQRRAKGNPSASGQPSSETTGNDSIGS